MSLNFTILVYWLISEKSQFVFALQNGAAAATRGSSCIHMQYALKTKSVPVIPNIFMHFHVGL